MKVFSPKKRPPRVELGGRASDGPVVEWPKHPLLQGGRRRFDSGRGLQLSSCQAAQRRTLHFTEQEERAMILPPDHHWTQVQLSAFPSDLVGD